MSKLKPFVKWTGGKRQLLQQLEERMPDTYNTYYEPFIGGGALFLDIAPQKAVINDLNSQLVNAYQQIRDNCDDVLSELDKLNKTKCSAERFYKLRDKYNEKLANNTTDIESCVLFIYILYTCFNGLYRLNKSGKYNAPFGKHEHAGYDKDNIIAVSNYLSNNDITIINGDFEDAVKNATKGDFVYFDSPYVPETITASFTSYTAGGFGETEHRRLAKLCRELDERGVMFMLSNNDVDFVHELYEGFNIDSVSARRSINRDATKRKGMEVIIKNY